MAGGRQVANLIANRCCCPITIVKFGIADVAFGGVGVGEQPQGSRGNWTSPGPASTQRASPKPAKGRAHACPGRPHGSPAAAVPLSAPPAITSAREATAARRTPAGPPHPGDANQKSQQVRCESFCAGPRSGRTAGSPVCAIRPLCLHWPMAPSVKPCSSPGTLTRATALANARRTQP